jgi:tRNA-2-methylthio-N6-dimethylallyladenosine synthase
MSLSRFQTRSRGDDHSAPALHVVTFGCQMNKYDSLLVEGRFVERGWRLTEKMEEADAILFNTCSVRQHAEERVYSWLGELKRLKRARPDLVIGVVGCMAQRAGEEIFSRAGHVDIVCGTRRFPQLPDLIEELWARREREADGSRAGRRLLETDMAGDVRVDRTSEVYAGGTTAYLAVMRGCDLRCTYCIVPSVRGRVRSRELDELVREARWMVEGGARVITLLGQTVNSYGRDLPTLEVGGARRRPILADVLRALQELEGLERVRLITGHPAYLTEALAEAIRDCDKVDRFLPLPAQSGSDEVLRRMRRGYDTDLYRRRVELLRNTVGEIELGSDWIVGFPGETDRDHAATEAFLAEIGFAQNYAFRYDPRPGTPAAAMEDDVPLAVKKERHRSLLEACERVSGERMRAWIGRTVSVFVEGSAGREAGALRGLSRQGLAVSFTGEDAGEDSLVGETARVRIEGAGSFGLTGILD